MATMKTFIGPWVPWSAAILAFLGGAALAAGVIPVVLYNASKDLTAVLVVLFGLATVPAGTALGFGLKNKLANW
jgi:hypothetical protein